MEHTYICIDLKSFYASVECVDRNLNPLTTNLVVADEERTDKTICLAVSPSLKAYGIPGRERLFVVKQKVKEVNLERLRKSPKLKLTGESSNSFDLNSNPELAVSFVIAKPRMAKYIEVSSKIYEVYLKYIASEDIHVYSIDEVFIDVTKYLKPLKMNAHELAITLIREVLKETGITATAGIGTNMFLAKVAMDIVAKKMPADKDGVRIAELDEMSFREKLWSHKPLIDFWRVGRGIEARLNKLGLFTMGDIALCSVGRQDEYFNEDLLYKEFGINAELLIDHAWGYEPCLMEDIKAYKPDNNSLSSGQVLHEPYDYNKAKLVAKEMADQLSLDLVEKGLVTNSISLYIGYDIENCKNEEIMRVYKGEVAKDYMGRLVPKPVHAGINLEKFTSSSEIIVKAISLIFERICSPLLSIRRINIGAGTVIPEIDVKDNVSYTQMSLFVDYEALEKKNELEKAKSEREKKAQKAILDIKKKYGKNSILKAMNLEEGATMKDRNEQIGGHKA